MANNPTLDAAEALESALRDIEAKTKQLLENSVDFEETLKESNKSVISLDTLLESIISKSNDLPKGIRSVSDLIKKMSEDSSLFNKIQAESIDLAKDQVKNAYMPAVKSFTEALDLAQKLYEKNKENKELQEIVLKIDEKRKALREKFGKELDNVIGSTKKQFAALKDNLKVQQEMKQEMFDTKAVLDNIGNKIRNPSQAAEGFLGFVSQMPKKFVKARQEGASMGEAMGAAFDVKKIASFAKYLAHPVVAAIVAVTAVLVVLWKLFKNYYDFIDKKVMPAQAEFNKQLGNTGEAAGKLRGQMVGMGMTFDKLGVGFEQGAAMVRNFAEGMMSVEPFDRETMLAAENLVGVLGMGGEAAGKFALQFKKQDGNLKMLHKSMVQAEKDANAYGIPVAQIQKDMAQSPEILARFGTQAALQFEKSALKARTLGLSIKEVNQAFGDQLDTFEGTSEAAAKLNAIFGTNINSMELMMETNPEKRMMMLREELQAQGKSWNDLNVFEKDMIATTLKVDKAQAALILSSEKERRALESKAAARKLDEKTATRWNKGVARLQRTLMAWGPTLEQLMLGFGDLVAAMFGIESPGESIGKLMSWLRGTIQDVTTWLHEQADAWRAGGDELNPFIRNIKTTIHFFSLWYKSMNLLTLPFRFIIRLLGTLINKFLKVTGLSKYVGGAFDLISRALHKVTSWLDKITDFNILDKIFGEDDEETRYRKKQKAKTGHGEDLELVPLVPEASKPVRVVPPKKKMPKRNQKGKTETVETGTGTEVTLLIEGSDELAEVLARMISIQQVRNSV